MRERPILFSGPMVRAILAGTKSQTRRLVKSQPILGGIDGLGDGWLWWPRGAKRERWNNPCSEQELAQNMVGCPFAYANAGDRLWVRETHCAFHVGEGMDRPVPECVAYRATDTDENNGFEYVNTRGESMHLTVTKWTPAIHMPRWASRITLEVTGVRVERLQAIGAADAVAEGVIDDAHGWDGNPTYPLARFRSLWIEINGETSWNDNPWIWVVAFRRVEQEARAA